MRHFRDRRLIKFDKFKNIWIGQKYLFGNLLLLRWKGNEIEFWWGRGETGFYKIINFSLLYLLRMNKDNDLELYWKTARLEVEVLYS